MDAPWEIDDELLALATPGELREYLEALAVIGRDWRGELARPEQLPPDGDWRVWFVRGGRGGGKTRTGAETFAEYLRASPGQEFAVVGPTFSAARDICIEGPSGLLRVLGDDVLKWNRNPNDGSLRLRNQAVVFVDGAKDGAPGVQGHNLTATWADEPGKWAVSRWKEAWIEGVEFATRIGIARIIVTGTPKQGHPLVKKLIEDASVRKTLLRTLDNAANLAPQALQAYLDAYANTRLGRQELEGEFLDDVEGALWLAAQLEAVHTNELPDMRRVVVSVDPSGGDEDGNDEQGIIGAGLGVDGLGYVLADRSCKLPPDGWARRAVQLYHDLKADAIIAERNFGGDMVEATIKAIDRNVRVKMVTASRGKVQRAEPVAALYGDPTRPETWPAARIRHSVVGDEDLGRLESQMTKWTPKEGWSPDRMDALVWALTELMLPGGSPWQLLGSI